MPPTDISEKGLETLIVGYLTGMVGSDEAAGGISDVRGRYRIGSYVEGDRRDYDRAHAVDWAKLLQFLQATQPKVVEQFDLETEGPQRQGFLDRLQGEVTRRGVVDVLRKGFKHGPLHVVCFYGTPSPDNPKAQEDFRQNIFSVTRQLQYSPDQTKLALDLVLFINGLPVATFELKNSLTKQTVQQAVDQYKSDRDPKEMLFQFGRCLVHVAVDEHEVRFCTELKGQNSWFLPFNKGYQDGAGNPPNPDGLKTDYLWKEILVPERFTEIIENYAGIVEEKDANGKKTRKQVFPRYHQLDVVRKLLAHARAHGAGQRYLIQHSAGSGKSNSIAWLAHQLVELERDGETVFDSVIVVTDRRILDQQIKNTIKGFATVSSIIGWAESSGDLRRFLEAGKKIVISTVQKFPFVLKEIETEHATRRFAILIDEAHSSQGGKATTAMHQALGMAGDEEDDETIEDEINRLIASRRMLPNASYFAFTATPKNKTLELFGTPGPMELGKTPHRPFHTYSMKQAIQEGFILDVLGNYTPYRSFYRLAKTIEGDPEFDSAKAQKKLRRYVETHPDSIRKKAEIIVEHFHGSVWGAQKIGGRARAMVVCNGIARAIEYFEAITAALQARKSPFKAIVAFSGEHQRDGGAVTEATLNGFPSNKIAETFRGEPYRFLVCADKFQTGYDEPLLHTMYVDKPLAGIKAVQTLSRLNRAMPGKHDTFVLDFANDVETITHAFQDYYRTTVLSDKTDPNKLHDLKAALDDAEVYAWPEVEETVRAFLTGALREQLDPRLDLAVERYKALDEEEQVAFKGGAKAFGRTYNFLSAILPYGFPEWEQLSIYLDLLIPRLPAPKEEDLSRGILETVSLESYRTQKQETIKISLEDEDATIDPATVGPGHGQAELALELLSVILKTFHERYGNIDWKDEDKIRRVLTEELPAAVAADKAYQNAVKQGDEQNARIELNRVLAKAITDLVMDHSDLYKHFMQNPDFKRQLSDDIFGLTYRPTPTP